MTTCPVCATRTSPESKYAPCCSRGCASFKSRQETIAADIARRKAKLPSVIAAARAMQPVERPAPAPSDLIRCCGCSRDFPDWAIYESPNGNKRCTACHKGWLARRAAADDRAVPGAPYEGGGVRVIRSTKSFS